MPPRTIPLPKNVPPSLKFGSVSFRVFATKDGRLGFLYKDGSRWKQILRRDIARLRSDAERIALGLLNAETAALDMTAEDRRIYVTASESLEPTGITVDAAAREFAEAWKISGGVPLRELANFYKKNGSARLAEISVARAAGEHLARNAPIGGQGRFKRDVRNDVAKIVGAFGPRMIAEVTAAELAAWLGAEQTARGFGWKRYNHLRSQVVYLWNFAKAHRDHWLPQDRATAAERTETQDEPRRGSPVEIYNPVEMRAWIANIRPQFLPWLLICGFSTVRSEEAAPPRDTDKDALRWEDFVWSKKFIAMRAESSKVNRPRHIPIPDNLMLWLEPWRNETGPVCPGEQPSKKETGRLGEITGFHIDGQLVKVKWKKNALRHTVISARLGIEDENGTQLYGAAQVAKEAGTSEAIISKRYHRPLDNHSARAWFGIFPDRAQNVLPLWERRQA